MVCEWKQTVLEAAFSCLLVILALWDLDARCVSTPSSSFFSSLSSSLALVSFSLSSSTTSLMRAAVQLSRLRIAASKSMVLKSKSVSVGAEEAGCSHARSRSSKQNRDAQKVSEIKSSCQQKPVKPNTSQMPGFKYNSRCNMLFHLLLD